MKWTDQGVDIELVALFFPSSLSKQEMFALIALEFKMELLFGGSFMEVGAYLQRHFLEMLSVKLRLVDWTELRHNIVPIPYSYYDRKTLIPVKHYDPITGENCNYSSPVYFIIARLRVFTRV